MSDLFAPAYLEGEIDHTVRKFPVTAERACRIGRSENNSIVLDDQLASRNHAILQNSDSGCCYLSDLGSTNGTFVNGVRISTPVVLRSGDCIQIGNHQFTFRQETAKAPEPEVLDESATNLLLEVKLITVLVVDVRDFTGLARRLPAGKIGELTGALFREGGEALQQARIWGQKYVGDAVMAVWLHEAAEPGKDDFLRIFEGLAKLYAIASGLQNRFGLTEAVRIGAGVNTGLAWLGNFGSMATSNYTALGDAVNMAFRLESATKETGCDVVIGRTTYEFLARAADPAPFFEMQTLNLKGYDEPVRAYTGHLCSIADLLAKLRTPADPRT